MRRHLDSYYTPQDAVANLRTHCNRDYWCKGQRFYEPCVGTGNIITGFQEEILGCDCIPRGDWKTGDIDPSVNPDFIGDASDKYSWMTLQRQTGFTPDWTITNPPFNKAIDILENALEFSTKGVVLLLRLSFLEPTQRRKNLLSTNPPQKLIVLPRISFTGDGKRDSVTCAWMIWTKQTVEDDFRICISGGK